MIPKDYTKRAGEIFPMSFFKENNKENTHNKVPKEVIQTFKKIYKEHENGMFPEIHNT